MEPSELVRSAYESIERGDIDGLIGLLGDALVAIPGTTRISGDHSGTAFRAVATELVDRVRSGQLKRELVCTYEAPGGVIAVFDNFTGTDTDAQKYHTAEEWMFRDGLLVALLVYVHEYDVFADFWN